MWAARHRNFDNQSFTVRMNDLCQVNLDISVFWCGRGTHSDTTQFANNMPTRAETELYPEEKLTTREHCAIETLITNPLVKERVFYCLKDRFVTNRPVDIIFSTRIFGTLQAWNISQRLAKACRNSELFLKAKITKCELSAIEALITKPLETKGYFTVWMNDLCQVDRNISDFMTQIAELIQTINTQFAKRPADRSRNRAFSRGKNSYTWTARHRNVDNQSFG